MVTLSHFLRAELAKVLLVRLVMAVLVQLREVVQVVPPQDILVVGLPRVVVVVLLAVEMLLVA